MESFGPASERRRAAAREGRRVDERASGGTARDAEGEAGDEVMGTIGRRKRRERGRAETEVARAGPGIRH